MLGRKIVLDIETTGLNVEQHEITEIGCVEIFDYIPTGNTFHSYCNPCRAMEEDAKKITGLTDEFLKTQPLFKSIKQELLNFIDDSPIVAHNAFFDTSFIYKSLGYTLSNQIIDTLIIARSLFKSNNSLDALCKRFNIDTNHRSYHGALKDSLLLAKVYYFLSVQEENLFSVCVSEIKEDINEVLNREPIIFITQQELKEHEILCNKIKCHVF